MKQITLALMMAFVAFLISGCGETKDTSSDEVKDENKQTGQTQPYSQDESASKEKAGEDNVKQETAGKEKQNTEGGNVKLKVEDSKLESASFKVPTIHCDGCEKTISSSVKKLDGIQSVSADFDTKIVEVTFAGDKVSKEQIAKAIDDSGFKCEINN